MAKKNLSFRFGTIELQLQVHIIEDPAYNFLMILREWSTVPFADCINTVFFGFSCLLRVIQTALDIPMI